MRATELAKTLIDLEGDPEVVFVVPDRLVTAELDGKGEVIFKHVTLPTSNPKPRRWRKRKPPLRRDDCIC